MRRSSLVSPNSVRRMGFSQTWSRASLNWKNSIQRGHPRHRDKEQNFDHRLFIALASTSLHLSSFNYEKAGQLKGQSKISKLRRAAPNFPNQLETTTKRRELRRSFRARLFPR